MDRSRWRDVQQPLRRPIAIGVDVAAGGRDNTCWTMIDHAGVVEQVVADLGSGVVQVSGGQLRRELLEGAITRAGYRVVDPS